MSRGHDRERAVQRRLEEDDWVVTRAAGSLGIYDLHCSKHGQRTILVEVKSTAQGPYERFVPAHRADLEAVALRAGAVAVLAWWPPRGKLTWIFSQQWPKERPGKRALDALADAMGEEGFACVVDESAGLKKETQ